MLNPMSVMVLLDAEFRRLVLWVPVLLALGALAYFLWPYEPGLLGGVGVPAGVVGPVSYTHLTLPTTPYV